MSLRLIRPFARGVIKIHDRKKDEKGEFQACYHLLGPEYSPKPKMVKLDPPDGSKTMAQEIDKDGKKVFLDAKAFEVNDEAYVMEKMGAILEKC